MLRAHQQMTLSAKRRRMVEAAGVGEVVAIRYAGGARPGAVREVQVLRVYSDRILALCLASGRPKTFLLEKLEPMPLGTPIDFVPLPAEAAPAVGVMTRLRAWLARLGLFKSASG